VVTMDQSPSEIVNELLRVSMVIGALADEKDDANQ
jgi:hypothetical protein